MERAEMLFGPVDTHDFDLSEGEAEVEESDRVGQERFKLYQEKFEPSEVYVMYLTPFDEVKGN